MYAKNILTIIFFLLALTFTAKAQELPEKIELFHTFSPETAAGKPVYFFYKITVEPDNLTGRITFAVRVEGKELKSYMNFDKLYPLAEEIVELNNIINRSLQFFDTASAESKLNYKVDSQIIEVTYKQQKYLIGKGQDLPELFQKITSLINPAFWEKMKREKNDFIKKNTSN